MKEGSYSMSLRGNSFVGFLAVLLATIVSCGLLHAATSKDPSTNFPKGSPHLLDPVFALSYDPSKTKFLSAPYRIYHCGDLRNFKYKLFVFADVFNNGKEYYWLDGWIKVFPDRPDPGGGKFDAMMDPGILVISENSRCEVTCPCFLAYDEQSQEIAKRDGITDELAAALIRDAIDREISAFGGRNRLLDKIDAAYRTAADKRIDGYPKSDDGWHPLIRNELKRLRSEHR
jgi:hypothetical protein